MDFAKRRRFVVDFIFILVLFAVFMIAALFVVLFGTKIYSGTTRDMDSNYSKRTIILIISFKTIMRKTLSMLQIMMAMLL